DMRLADDRRNVVLAMRFEADVLEDDHLVVTIDLVEGTLQQLDGIGFITAEEFLVGAHHAIRRAAQSLARRIVPGPSDERAYGGFRGLAVGPPAPSLQRYRGIVIVVPRAARLFGHETLLEGLAGVAGRGTGRRGFNSD